MKKILVIVGLLVAVSPLAVARAQTVDQNAILIQLSQQLVQLVTILNDNLSAQTNALAQLQTRVAKLESTQGSDGSGSANVGAVTDPYSTISNADLNQIGVMQRDFGDDVRGVCLKLVGRRGWDRIFDLMCTHAGF